MGVFPLLDTAQGLLLQGGDPTRLVARRGVLIDHLPVAGEVVLELLHQRGRGPATPRRRSAGTAPPPPRTSPAPPPAGREPPMAITRSVTRPARGLAVMPERPSEPPHFSPTTSSSAPTGSRRSAAARSASSRSRRPPLGQLIPPRPGTPGKPPAGCPSGPAALAARQCCCSHTPAPAPVQPPALGWRIRPQRMALVCS